MEITNSMDIFDSVKSQECTNRSDIISRGCVGKFAVPHEYVDKVDPMLQTLLARVLVVQAHSSYHDSRIHYVGYSYLFESTLDGSTPPDYIIKVVIKMIPEHIPEVQASKWIEEKCVALNEIRDDKVFYARSAMKNHYYHGTPVKNDNIEKQYVVFNMERSPMPSDADSILTLNAGTHYAGDTGNPINIVSGGSVTVPKVPFDF